MKKCTYCKLEKPKTEFSKNATRKDGIQNICKECSKRRLIEAHKKSYSNRKHIIKENRKEEIERNKQIVAEHKLGGCKFCSEKDPVTLDFHHVNPKEKDLSISVIIHRYTTNKLVKEIEKCIVLCSNCHRKLHAYGEDVGSSPIGTAMVKLAQR